MPKKLTDCVKKVKEQGKNESEAWAICRESTGLDPHEGTMKNLTREQVNSLVIMADKLDKEGLYQEASKIDSILREAGLWDRLKDAWQAIKGNPQLQETTIELHNSMKRTTIQLKEAVENVMSNVATLEKLIEKPNLQHMAKWADLVSTMGDEIKVTLQAAKEAAAHHEELKELAQKTRNVGKGTPEVSGLGGLAGEEPVKPESPAWVAKLKEKGVDDETIKEIMQSKGA